MRPVLSLRVEPGLTLLSAFSGAGGMDLGLDAAGFSPIGCIEIEDDPRDTIRKNRPWRLLEEPDIVELGLSLTPGDVGLHKRELDVLAAGPPCQPFSSAAQWTSSGRNGLADDQRARALFALFDILDRFLPRAVLLENVPGFMRGPASAADWIDKRMEKIRQSAGVRYSIHTRILNASDYGVPQKRRRAVVVMLRDQDQFTWPSALRDENRVTAWDAIGSLEIAQPPGASGEWGDLLPSIPEGKNYQWHTERGGGLPLFGYRTRYWSFLLKLAKNRPAWTVQATAGPATGPFHWNNRPLDVAEMAALQTFPPDWNFAGSPRSAAKQIGNATPPLLSEAVGRCVRLALGSRFPDEGYVHAIECADRTPPPEPHSPVPEKYLHLIGDHPRHPGEGLGPAPRNVTA